MKWDFKHIAIVGGGGLGVILLIYLVYRHEQNASAAASAASDAASQAAAAQAQQDQANIDAIGQQSSGYSQLGAVSTDSGSGSSGGDSVAEAILAILAQEGTGATGTGTVTGTGTTTGTPTGGTPPSSGNPPTPIPAPVPGNGPGGTPYPIGGPVGRRPPTFGGTPPTPESEGLYLPAGSGTSTANPVPINSHQPGFISPPIIALPPGTFHASGNLDTN